MQLEAIVVGATSNNIRFLYHNIGMQMDTQHENTNGMITTTSKKIVIESISDRRQPTIESGIDAP